MGVADEMQGPFIEIFQLPSIQVPGAELELKFFILMRCNSEQSLCNNSQSGDSIWVEIGETTHEYAYSSLTDNIWLERSIRVVTSEETSRINVTLSEKRFFDLRFYLLTAGILL